MGSRDGYSLVNLTQSVRVMSFFRIMTVLFAVFTAMPVAAETLTVFAAASLKTALDPIARRYKELNGETVTFSFAGSSALARQIDAGAPADVFISANLDWMAYLEQQGMIDTGSTRVVLTNELVLIAAPDWQGDLSPAPGFGLAAALGDDGRLAMALVDAVPAGQYGKQALQTLGVWDAVAPRVAQADNVRAALRLVSLGEAPLGIVYATDAISDPTVRILGSFPADSHAPVTYPAAAVIGDKTEQAADFLAFLGSPDAISIFCSQGFGPKEDCP